MKFLLFGTGEYYNRYKIWFYKEDIIALVDNAKAKQGKQIDGILVIAPEDICQYEFDAVVIMSFYVKEMKTQLMGLGVNEDKIYHFYDLHNLIQYLSSPEPMSYYGIGNMQTGTAKSILLLNQDLTLGGPALALYHAARVLVKRGYQVVYGSMLDGPLREILLKEGISVVIDENLLLRTMKECSWVEKYSFIICNTINFHIFLSVRNKKVPIAWWLHDALFFYDGVSQEAMERIVQADMKIWAVGPISKAAVKTFRPDFKVDDLLYGVEETNRFHTTIQCKHKMRFTVIGYIESRKGQDVLVNAIQKLHLSIREKAEFYFVGPNTSVMAQNLTEIAKGIPEIVFTGPVDREKIDSYLEKTDVLICPSREDPMPTVAAEAMMHGVPCLISDAAGTAEYLKNGIDGMVFQSGNIDQLKEILETCILGKVDLEKMGKASRGVFEQYFSMNAFEKCFMELVHSVNF